MAKNRSHTTATAQRRQRQIEDCLYENLLCTPYPSISVADLCRQVGISRKAYYNYYHDKDACFCAIIDRLLQESMLCTTQSVPDDAASLDIAVAILNFWREHKSFFDIIIRNNLSHLLMLRSIEYVLQENQAFLELLNTPEVQADTDILACCMSILMTLVLQWYYRDFDTPTEEMARKFLRLLHDPMFPKSTKA